MRALVLFVELEPDLSVFLPSAESVDANFEVSEVCLGLTARTWLHGVALENWHKLFAKSATHS